MPLRVLTARLQHVWQGRKVVAIKQLRKCVVVFKVVRLQVVIQQAVSVPLQSYLSPTFLLLHW